MTLFSISSLLIFFASLGLGFLVFINNRSDKLNRSWFILSIAVALWGLALFGVTSSKTYEIAQLWQYLLDITAPFIPVLYYFFVSDLLKKSNLTGKAIGLIAAIIVALFSFSNLFKTGLSNTLGFYWVIPGQFYFVLPVFFLGYVLYSWFLLIRYILSEHGDSVSRAQVKYQLIASVVGFSGGATNFLPQYFDIFPFGNYLGLLYVFFVSYSIIKHGFFNLKAVATELFSGGIVLLFLLNLFTSKTVEDWIVRSLLLVLVTFFSVLLIRGVFREIENREKIELLAKKLEAANERLRFLDKQKSEFISIASHQLKSPLTAIKGYSSMLLEGSFGAVETKAKEAIKRVLQSSEHLVNLIEDLLNVSRLEQGKMKYDFKIVDLEAMVNEIIISLMPNAEAKKLRVELKTDHKSPYHIRADEEKIRQVILNLVDNAIKYTHKGFVNVEIVKTDGGKKILLSVSDSGVGIPKELISRLFEKFSRGEGESRKLYVNGTGLGLYVAKEMIKAHGGRIWAESPGEGKGSTFYIEMKEAGEAMYESRVNQFAKTI